MVLGAVIICCTCKSNIIVAEIMSQTWDVHQITMSNIPWEILIFMRLWLITKSYSKPLLLLFVFAVGDYEDHCLLGCNFAFQSRCYRFKVPLKCCQLSTMLHNVISQKTVISS